MATTGQTDTIKNATHSALEIGKLQRRYYFLSEISFNTLISHNIF